MKRGFLFGVVGAVFCGFFILLSGPTQTEASIAFRTKYVHIYCAQAWDLFVDGAEEEDVLRYFSSDPKVAVVTKLGRVMAVNPGVCTFTAISMSGERCECSVTVSDKPEEFKQIALSFDDGPDIYGQELLDYLLERDVRVTFFYVGNQVRNFTDNLIRARDEGHEIGNHSWSHANLKTSDSSKVDREIRQTNDAIFEAIGVYPTLLRPPYGSYNSTTCEYAGLPVILWSVDTNDWRYRDSDYVRDYIVEHARDGEIILVHEIHKTTVKAIPEAIDILKAEGWEFVTVSELLSRDGETPEAGKVYSNNRQ